MSLIPTLSIVAVHGIGADGDTTWTSKENNVKWLRDLLPGSTPNIRVLRYSWNSKWLGKDNIEQDCSAVAFQLLVSLKAAREVSLTYDLSAPLSQPKVTE